MSVYEIQLPWTAPPLSLNHRMHWRAKAKLTAQMRQAMFVLAKQARIGKHERVRVALHYRPRDRRVRDVDNPIPTLKVICDGLVDAGVVADDDPTRMVKDMPVIHDVVKGEGARMWLVVEALPPVEMSA